MISHSQNGEDIIIKNWFGDYKGTLLDIGANGVLLSNSELFIELGFQATLVEPDKRAYKNLEEHHRKNHRVQCINVAVGNQDKEVDFYLSGSHLNKNDVGLLSTASQMDYEKWKTTTDFEKTKVRMLTFEKLLEISELKKFDFITVDAENYDLDLLLQMDLSELGCKVLCIEHNSKEKVKRLMIQYCSKFGLTDVLDENAENIILAIKK